MSASSALLIAIASVIIGLANGQIWTNIVRQPTGSYPTTLGAAGGFPGARYQPASWNTANGGVWMFGGFGFGTTSTGGDGPLNDLWYYNGTAWFFWGGATTIDDPGSSTQPKARSNAAAWLDATGTFLYMYGGVSTDPAYLSDMWVYNTQTHVWANLRVSADNSAPVYNTQPPAIAGASTWYTSGSTGKFYLFGGIGNAGIYNDIWSYTPAAGNTAYGTWAWLAGSKAVNSGGSGTTQPSARFGSLDYNVAGSTNLYLFGGSAGTTFFNDFWSFSTSTNVWTYLYGTQTANSRGTYNGVNTVGTPASRSYGGAWTDTMGNFWIFGGLGQGSGLLNDLWRCTATACTQIAGTAATNVKDVYTPAASTYPGGRYGEATWIDNVGELAMFGGTGLGAGNVADLNQLWIYNGSPLLSTSSQTSSSVSASTIGVTTSNSASVAAVTSSTSARSSSSTASNFVSTSTTGTFSASTSTTATSTSATIAASTSSTASTLGNNVALQASSSSTTFSTGATVASSSSSSAASTTASSTASTASNALTSSLSNTVSTSQATSTSSASTSITATVATSSTQSASTSATSTTASTLSASTSSTVSSATTKASASTSSTASVSTSSTGASVDSAATSSTSTADLSQTSSLSSLAETQSSSSLGVTTSSASASSTSTGKATTIGQVVASTSSTQASTTVTRLTVTLTSTVATTASTSTRATSSSTSATTSSTLSTSTSTTGRVSGAVAITPLLSVVSFVAALVILL